MTQAASQWDLKWVYFLTYGENAVECDHCISMASRAQHTPDCPNYTKTTRSCLYPGPLHCRAPSAIDDDMFERSILRDANKNSILYQSTRHAMRPETQ